MWNAKFNRINAFALRKYLVHWWFWTRCRKNCNLMLNWPLFLSLFLEHQNVFGQFLTFPNKFCDGHCIYRLTPCSIIYFALYFSSAFSKTSYDCGETKSLARFSTSISFNMNTKIGKATTWFQHGKTMMVMTTTTSHVLNFFKIRFSTNLVAVAWKQIRFSQKPLQTYSSCSVCVCLSDERFSALCVFWAYFKWKW